MAWRALPGFWVLLGPNGGGSCVGSAAVLVFVGVSQWASQIVGMRYVLLFGIGSMLGMAALSAVIAVPLAASARWLTWANRALQGWVGLITMAIGATTIYSSAVV